MPSGRMWLGREGGGRHALLRTSAQALERAHMHACGHARVHAWVHACKRTAQACTAWALRAAIHADACACGHAPMQMCMRTHGQVIFTCAHSHPPALHPVSKHRLEQQLLFPQLQALHTPNPIVQHHDVALAHLLLHLGHRQCVGALHELGRVGCADPPRDLFAIAPARLRARLVDRVSRFPQLRPAPSKCGQACAHTPTYTLSKAPSRARVAQR
eukprot:357305-Chlamydomonas_euryale.AAC.4